MKTPATFAVGSVHSSLLTAAFLISSSALAAPATGSNAMNPDLSLDGLFSLSQFNRDNPVVFDGGHDPKFNGFNLQQVELTFGSNVDPYFRGDANVVLTAEGIEVEEAYGTTLDLPANLQLKAGQFYTAFGRHNPTHPHQWDWANKPLVLGRFFGGDGLRNLGLQASWLTPLPWYSELIVSGQNSTGKTVQSFRADGGTVSGMRNPGDYLYLARTNNFVGLSDSLSLNAGASFLMGPNNTAATARTRILGGDLYLKYREPHSVSFVALQAEVLRRLYDTDTASSLTDSGATIHAMVRLGEPWQRWMIGLRYDWTDPKAAPVQTAVAIGGADPDTAQRWRISPVITFYPTEFSKLRLQYDYDKPADLAYAQQAVHLEFEILMGAHGAHKF